MLELNMDDPFGFNKSVESGEFKLEGVGKLYGQDEETPIDGLECEFEATVKLEGKIRGVLHLNPINPPFDLYRRITQVWDIKRGGIWVCLLRLESQIERRSLRFSDVFLRSVGQTIIGEFERLEWGDVYQNYTSCVAWIPNLEFGGNEFTEYDGGRIRSRDTCQFSFSTFKDGVNVQLKQLPGYKEILERLKDGEGSLISAVCELSFSVKQSLNEIQGVFDDFFQVVAFALGRRIAPVACWLFNPGNSLFIDLRIKFSFDGFTTWCRYDFPSVFHPAIQQLFSWYISQSKEFQVLMKWVIDIYLTRRRSVFEVDILLLATLYEMYMSLDNLLNSNSRNYPLSKSSRKRLGENLKKFLREETGLPESEISEWVNNRKASFIRRPFKDQIKALFKEQGIAVIERYLDDFVDARNVIAHPNLKELRNRKRFDSHDPKFHIALQYMLRQFEVITLKMMGYTGEFQDRCNDYPRVPFSQMLEELKLEAAESE